MVQDKTKVLPEHLVLSSHLVALLVTFWAGTFGSAGFADLRSDSCAELGIIPWAFWIARRCRQRARGCPGKFSDAASFWGFISGASLWFVKWGQLDKTV
jgi:hypothetical protein